MTIERFQELVPLICARETSADPQNWSEKNPLWGHCAVVSLLAQELFGGSLLRRSLAGIPGLEYLRSHYSNRLPNGEEIDFTLEQFEGRLPENLPTEERERERALSYPDTERRYALLKKHFEERR
ncbi:MAG TPA: hypothetical protein VD967_01415 [Candidatus Paceibacterota bacterium]|nr:hypothetical protein [Candidatus Paceibacterota bacterium]